MSEKQPEKQPLTLSEKEAIRRRKKNIGGFILFAVVFAWFLTYTLSNLPE